MSHSAIAVLLALASLMCFGACVFFTGAALGVPARANLLASGLMTAGLALVTLGIFTEEWT